GHGCPLLIDLAGRSRVVHRGLRSFGPHRQGGGVVTETVPASRRAWRRARARELAAPFGGVVHRRHLRDAGICRDEVRSELRGQRWTALGRHTIGIDTALVPQDWPAKAAWAVWETGSGAVLDGVSALLAAGLENYTED